jgi:hypothetical protein
MAYSLLEAKPEKDVGNDKAFMPLPCRKTGISGFLAASENLDAEAA